MLLGWQLAGDDSGSPEYAYKIKVMVFWLMDKLVDLYSDPGFGPGYFWTGV